MARTILSCLAAFGLLAAACAGSGGDTTSTRPPEPSVQATISLAEWRFAPAALTLPADSPAVLELRNTGGLAHEWALLSAVIAGESEFSDDNVVAACGSSRGRPPDSSSSSPSAATTRWCAPSGATSLREWWAA